MAVPLLFAAAAVMHRPGKRPRVPARRQRIRQTATGFAGKGGKGLRRIRGAWRGGKVHIIVGLADW